MVKVIINGCNGKMGQNLAEAIKDSDGIEAVAGIDRVDTGDNDFPVFTDTKEFKAIIPGKYLNEVCKNLLDVDDQIKIGISKNQALFEISNCKIIS